VALAEGHENVVLDDLSTGYAANLAGLAVRFHEGSVNDRDVLDPAATHHANATGTLGVLEGARRADVRHVVMSSSSSVYGLNPALPKSEREWVRPLSPYA
jgi:UDP-glucose 4-epimerase